MKNKLLLALLVGISFGCFQQVVSAQELLKSGSNTENNSLLDGGDSQEYFQQVKITDIEIRGTERKESVAIAMFLRVGDTVTPSQIREDLQRIFGLGYFTQNVNATREPYKDGFRLIIQLEENPILKEVKVTGNTIVTQEQINVNFSNFVGKIVNFNDLKESIEKTKELYTRQGYQAVSVVPQLSPQGILSISINEGIIEEIKPVGNVKTSTNVIMREIRQKAGDVFNIDIMRDDLRRISNTNYFENVDIKPSAGKKDPNHIIIDIVLKEKGTASMNVGGGYNTRDGIVGTFNISENDFLGNGQRIGLDLQLGAGWFSSTGGANGLGKLDWYDPWFLPTFFPARTGFGFSLYRQRQANYFQYAGNYSQTLSNGSTVQYDYPLINDRTGFSLSFSRAIFGDPLTSPWRVSLSITSEAVSPTIPRTEDLPMVTKDSSVQYIQDLENSSNPLDAKSIQELRTGFQSYVDNNIKKNLTVSKKGVDNRVAGSLSLSYDTRDFAPDPHEGWNNVISLEPSLGDIQYFKLLANVNKYIPVSVPFLDKCTFALGGRVGALMGDKVSIYERFFSGGIDTIRGWPENGYLSGERVAVGSAEFRFPIYNIVSGVLFFDVGNFWNQDWKVTADNTRDSDLSYQFLRYGAGLGIRLNTPLGALRMDYGIRDFKNPFDLGKGAQFHFNIGQKF